VGAFVGATEGIEVGALVGIAQVPLVGHWGFTTEQVPYGKEKDCISQQL
jgi:hypothetical protein